MHEVWKKVLDMVICLAIFYCHLVCGGGKAKLPCKSYPCKKRSKKGKDQFTELGMERLFENLGQ